MIKFRQKLLALLMILSFSISALPVFAISNNQVSTYMLNKGQETEEALPTSLELVGKSNIKNGNKRLSVSLRDSNVKQTLRMFADKAGLNIIFHDSVEDKNITLDLVGVTLNDALRMVMQATDLSYFIDGETLVIMSAEKSKELHISKQNIMILPVKYSDATDIAQFLNKNIFSINKPGLSNTEIVAVDPAKNQLVIFGTPSDYQMAVDVLKMLDTPVRVTNFKVNHVTPKEMSKNLCMALIKGYSQDEEEDSSSDDSDDDDDDDDSDDSSGGGSSGQSSGLSAGDAGGSKVKLGQAKLACVTGDASSDKQGGGQQQGALYSLNRNGIKVMYYETLGLISIVGGSQDQLDTIAAYISATDMKQPMAYIEFSIIELTEEGSKTLETNWNFLTQNFGLAFNSISGSGASLIVSGNGADKSPINFIAENKTNNLSGKSTLQGFFKYLIDNGKAKTLANPKIMATSGKESVIDLSQDYLKTLRQTNTVGVSSVTALEPELGSDAGIIISVTPYISKDGYIVMNLGPTYATTLTPIISADTGEILATPLSRRNLNLKNVRVKDGDTLVLGGLIQEIETQNVAKIPILGDIPGIGVFFRNTRTSKKKQELVILITPHIVKDSEDIVTTGEEIQTNVSL